VKKRKKIRLLIKIGSLKMPSKINILDEVSGDAASKEVKPPWRLDVAFPPHRNLWKRNFLVPRRQDLDGPRL
jgi:hypothetical protein